MSSYSEWEHGVSNRNWHILQNLLSDDRVDKILAIDYLPHNFKRALRNYKENILQANKKIVYRSPLSRVFEITNKLHVYSSVLPIISGKNFYAELNKIIKKFKFDDFILISYYPLRTEYFKTLNPILKVFEAVDDWSNHSSFKKYFSRIRNNYKIISQECDLIFIVSEELESLFTNKEKIFWIPNAVDFQHYQRIFPLVNRDIGLLPKPIIGYLGTIQDRLDQDLLIYLAKSNPSSSIALVGPVWSKDIKEKLSVCKNIHFLGKKSYEQSPMYIQQFDVAIVPHKTSCFSQSANPMKIFDYLSCGKPVVSTRCSNLEIFGDLIFSTSDYQEFNSFINHALDEDKEFNQQKRREFAKEHSWDRRTDKMLGLIFSKI